MRYRVLLEREMLDLEPGLFDQLAAAIAAGEQIRITDSVPIKLLIVDHEFAFVPVGPADATAAGALLMRQSGLLDAMARSSSPNGTTPPSSRLGRCNPGDQPGAIDDVDAQILGLLLAGLNDQAVAYQLDLAPNRPTACATSDGSGAGGDPHAARVAGRPAGLDGSAAREARRLARHRGLETARHSSSAISAAALAAPSVSTGR